MYPQNIENIFKKEYRIKTWSVTYSNSIKRSTALDTVQHSIFMRILFLNKSVFFRDRKGFR